MSTADQAGVGLAIACNFVVVILLWSAWAYSRERQSVSVCKSCKGQPHRGQPEDCPGGTYCDCQHRGPTESEVSEESAA